MTAIIGVLLTGAAILGLAWTFQGFGGNRGSATEAGLASDARAARAYLATRG